MESVGSQLNVLPPSASIANIINERQVSTSYRVQPHGKNLVAARHPLPPNYDHVCVNQSRSCRAKSRHRRARLNIALEVARPGGINASQRLDPAAKSVGQRLVGMGVGG